MPRRASLRNRLPLPEPVPIPVPTRGLHESATGVNQPEGTYPAGLNVRSRSEDSEEAGIARRSGFRSLATGLAGGPREIFLAARETPPYLWRELMTTAQAGVTPSVVTQRWAAAHGSAPIAWTQGDDGTSYVLRDDGSIETIASGSVLRDANGEVLFSLTTDWCVCGC